MKIALHHISISQLIDNDNLTLRVEYTPEGGSLTIDYGQYIVSGNSYYPAIDLDAQPNREAEFYALQEKVEAR